jgi:WD40 repeat protein
VEGQYVGTLRLLDAATPADKHDGEVFGCAYTPDSAFVLSGGWDGHLRLWDAATGGHLAALRASPKPLSCCAFTPDNKQWVAGTMDGLLSFWDGVSHQTTLNFLAHTRPVSAITFAPDGQTLATASWDRQIVLRKVGKEREGGRVLTGHEDIVAGCRFTPDSKQLLSWSHDRSVRLWDVDSARVLSVFPGHKDRVTAASLSPDGRWAASVGRDGALRLWDLIASTEIGGADLGREGRGCFFLLDGESLVSVDAQGRLMLLSLPRFEIQAQLNTSLKVMCGELAPSGDQLALGCEDGTIQLVAIDGLESASIVVTATQSLKPTSSLLGRLIGSSRLTRTYQYTCPVCREPAETTTLPTKPVSCAKCQRQLSIKTREMMLV